MSDISGMIESAMKDPRFAGILSSLKDKADSGELDVSSLMNEISGEKEEKKPSAVATGAGMESHKKLLSALRPYLGDKKRAAVDEILKIGEFSGVIEALTKRNDGRQ